MCERNRAAMDFGFYLPCYWPDPARPWSAMYPEMLEQARLAEAMGFASLSIPEHHFMNYLTHPSALLSAVKVASVTERVPIITSVLVLPFTDVRMLAGQITQTDHLTEGRLQLGVGRGAFRYEFERLGKKAGREPRAIRRVPRPAGGLADPGKRGLGQPPLPLRCP